MGTFVGHIVPGLALAVLGLWHTINTIRAYYLKGGQKFEIRFWYPLNCAIFKLKLKHLELLLILSFSVVAIFMQVLDFPLFRFSFELINFEHATMFLHLVIFSGFTLLAEFTQSPDTLFPVTGILAASVFGQEFFLLHFHSADHVGLEGHYHYLLQIIVFLSFFAALSAATNFGSSFHAALVLSILVLFQGLWFMNMGFMLWIPEFVPKGCVVQFHQANTGDHIHGGAVTCESRESYVTAKALANLQFSWIFSGILMFTGFVTLIFAGKSTPRCQITDYEKLDSRKIDVPIDTESLRQSRV